MAVRMAHRPTGWRTVFVSPTLPTLLMLPGVIVMMALPARVRAGLPSEEEFAAFEACERV